MDQSSRSGHRLQLRRRTPVVWVGACTVAIGGAAMLSGCQAPMPEPPQFALTIEKWAEAGPSGKRILTDHWDIRTTVRDEEFQRLLPTFMESSHRQYEQLLPALSAREQRPLVVYLFQTRAEWDRFSRKHFPRKAATFSRIQSGAYCEGDLAVCYYIKRDRTLSVMAHEGLHQYISRNYQGEIPAWLNEGLATFCEGYEYKDGLPLFQPNRNEFRLNALRQALLSKQLIPFARLLGTHAGDVIVHANPQVYSYYSQAWALIVYLRTAEKGRYAASFDELLKDLGTGRLRLRAGAYIAARGGADGEPMSFGEAVFRVYITEDVDAFATAYEEYLKKLVDFRSSGVTAPETANAAP
jgi:hypothetical protein